MKSKILLLAIVAITLLSFTVVSVRKAVTSNGAPNVSAEHGSKGFALQDNDQFLNTKVSVN